MQPTYIWFSCIIGILRRRRKKSPIQPENQEQSTSHFLRSFPRQKLVKPETKKETIHGPWLKTLKFKGRLGKTNTPVNMNLCISRCFQWQLFGDELIWWGVSPHKSDGDARFVATFYVAKWDGKKTEAYRKKCVCVYIYMYYIYIYVLILLLFFRRHATKWHAVLAALRKQKETGTKYKLPFGKGKTKNRLKELEDLNSESCQ